MILHVFNPSHDEALAADTPYYTPTRAAEATALRYRTLPARWAAPGDAVWIGSQPLQPTDPPPRPGVLYLTTSQLTPDIFGRTERIDPWGWDKPLRHCLQRLGAPARLLPSDQWLDTLRRLSSRQTAVTLLPLIRQTLEEKGLPTAGTSVMARSEDEIEQYLSLHPHLYVKSLWSCSGRGVFQLHLRPTAPQSARIRKLLSRDKSVELEPAYDRLLDFALEFHLHAGHCRYLGLSVFSAGPQGQYLANQSLPQEQLRHILNPYLTAPDGLDTLVQTLADILHRHLAPHYQGPLGVDMMAVSHKGRILIHPCVEINLRRTMGHAALCHD